MKSFPFLSIKSDHFKYFCNGTSFSKIGNAPGAPIFLNSIQKLNLFNLYFILFISFKIIIK
jgi:hypothetical protein